ARPEVVLAHDLQAVLLGLGELAGEILRVSCHADLDLLRDPRPRVASCLPRDVLLALSIEADRPSSEPTGAGEADRPTDPRMTTVELALADEQVRAELTGRWQVQLHADAAAVTRPSIPAAREHRFHAQSPRRQHGEHGLVEDRVLPRQV